MPSSDRTVPRRRLSYANVTSTLSLFLVLAGGVAIAASVPKNSVKSKSIKDNVVQSKDLKDGRAVAGADVIDDSLSGADVDEGSLSVAPSGPAGGSLRGSYPNPTLAPNSVGNSEVADNAISSDNVVGNSLGGAVIADASLNGLDLQDDGVQAADLGPSSVSSSEIADFSLGAADVATDFAQEVFNYPSIANGTCNTDLQPNPPRANSLSDSAISITPGAGFSGFFTIATEIQSSTVFAVKVCNVGMAAADPDGAGTTYTYVVFDPTP